MKILAIETSCDETAVSIITRDSKSYTIFTHEIFSQIDIHQEYGGVFPALAKRAHAEHLPHLLKTSLDHAGYQSASGSLDEEDSQFITETLHREPGMAEHMIELLSAYRPKDIDAIAVTYGPGLEPALWVGINTARILSRIWNIPLVPVNHMEGHIASSEIHTLEEGMPHSESEIAYPALALLISGGHTELVSMKSKGDFELIGQTRDDAIGEAFDKVARMLGLPYPGGPEIEKIANDAPQSDETYITLPRPMMASDTCDMSFSGLKTAVRYFVNEHQDMNDKYKSLIAREFQQAISDVLVSKLRRALSRDNYQSLIIAGGVSANKTITQSIANFMYDEFADCTVRIPLRSLATDNALMIAYAAYDVYMRGEVRDPGAEISADGNLMW